MKAPSPMPILRGVIALMRPKHWIKNGFVLAPLLFTGEFLNVSAVEQVLQAVLLFCLASSATYVVNDIRDRESDRQHPLKSRTRPLAAGVVTVPVALVLLLVLYGAVVLGWSVAPEVVEIIAAYIVLNLAYTFVLKRQPVVDIFTIAIGFVLRVYAGATALAVPVSNWMFVTTLCLALYLAAVKRRQELRQSADAGSQGSRQYSVALTDRYAEMSATGALVFYGMFVMSSKPQLVITVPLVLFGIFRYWYVVEEREGGESPTDALLDDWPLMMTIVLWAVACAWALWPSVA